MEPYRACEAGDAPAAAGPAQAAGARGGAKGDGIDAISGQVFRFPVRDRTLLFLVAVGGVAGLLYHYSKDLPDHSQLQDYEPPVMTRVHAGNGELLAEYAKERRLYLPIQAIPKLVTNAFISAEDKNFYEHPGLDFNGIALVPVGSISRTSEPASPAAGRFHDHPAGGQELFVDQRGVVLP